MSNLSLQDQLEALKAENTALKLKASTPKVLTIKVSEKGGVSVYGLGRFPVTLYRSQWEKLISHVPAIQAFIEANAAKLTVKEEPVAVPTK
jgi:hypothetical protein